MQEEQHPQVRQLRKQMVTLLAQTRENEEKAQRYRDQEAQFLAVEGLANLVRSVIEDYRHAFDLDAVTLVLDDPDYQVQRLLEDGGMELANEPRLKFLATQFQLRDAAKLPRAAKLGPFDHSAHSWLFAGGEMMLKSVAEIPLQRGERVIGSLNLASHSAKRFPPQAKPGLLMSMANVLAVSLENALSKQRLEQVSLTDPLTGVANRKYLDRRLEEEAARARRSSEPMACLLIELDKFDELSQQHGRRSADEALVSMAEVVTAQLRSSDTVARYDGVTFAALLVRTNGTESEYVAERIREVIRDRTFGTAEDKFHVSVSIGATALRFANNKVIPRNIADRLAEEADKCLKQASEAGGDRVIASVIGS